MGRRRLWSAASLRQTEAFKSPAVHISLLIWFNSAQFVFLPPASPLFFLSLPPGIVLDTKETKNDSDADSAFRELTVQVSLCL